MRIITSSEKIILISFLCVFLLSFSFVTDKWNNAKVDSKGNIILIESKDKSTCKYTGSGMPIIVQNDWAIMIFYMPPLNPPKKPDSIINPPAYYILNNKTNQYFETRSFISFLNELNVIPNSSKVEHIDACTNGLYYAMPIEFHDKLDSAMTKKNFSISRPFFCTCCMKNPRNQKRIKILNYEY